MKPSILVWAFVLLPAVGLAQDSVSSASPPRKTCVSSVLPRFATPVIQVSFEIPKSPIPKRPFNFADANKRRVCDGTWCGCEIEEQECEAGCPSGEPAHGLCVDNCNHQYVRCAVCCCCWECPPSCG
jgi:hypothetical protein